MEFATKLAMLMSATGIMETVHLDVLMNVKKNGEEMANATLSVMFLNANGITVIAIINACQDVMIVG